ncbi:hypothetical protein ElyMa_006252500 [Elysia marginata]|uniref:Uncharacterized protein n=1 Tax=Elysia marginata TaxID=1093978 RepID=A0AAV4HA03_9GAST|nr:hypothetical protein ElyMa_006252500 [Elysia marginata]
MPLFNPKTVTWSWRLRKRPSRRRIGLELNIYLSGGCLIAEEKVILKTAVTAEATCGVLVWWETLSFRTEKSGVRVLLSAGRDLVLEKGFLHTFFSPQSSVERVPNHRQ